MRVGLGGGGRRRAQGAARNWEREGGTRHARRHARKFRACVGARQPRRSRVGAGGVGAGVGNRGVGLGRGGGGGGVSTATVNARRTKPPRTLFLGGGGGASARAFHSHAHARRGRGPLGGGEQGFPGHNSHALKPRRGVTYRSQALLCSFKTISQFGLGAKLIRQRVWRLPTCWPLCLTWHLAWHPRQLAPRPARAPPLKGAEDGTD